jgi:hypothetical protein
MVNLRLGHHSEELLARKLVAVQLLVQSMVFSPMEISTRTIFIVVLEFRPVVVEPQEPRMGKMICCVTTLLRNHHVPVNRSQLILARVSATAMKALLEMPRHLSAANFSFLLRGATEEPS